MKKYQPNSDEKTLKQNMKDNEEELSKIVKKNEVNS